MNLLKLRCSMKGYPRPRQTSNMPRCFAAAQVRSEEGTACFIARDHNKLLALSYNIISADI